MRAVPTHLENHVAVCPHHRRISSNPASLLICQVVLPATVVRVTPPSKTRRTISIAVFSSLAAPRRCPPRASAETCTSDLPKRRAGIAPLILKNHLSPFGFLNHRV